MRWVRLCFPRTPSPCGFQKFNSFKMFKGFQIFHVFTVHTSIFFQEVVFSCCHFVIFAGCWGWLGSWCYLGARGVISHQSSVISHQSSVMSRRELMTKCLGRCHVCHPSIALYCVYSYFVLKIRMITSSRPTVLLYFYSIFQ